MSQGLHWNGYDLNPSQRDVRHWSDCSSLNAKGQTEHHAKHEECGSDVQHNALN